MDDLPSDMSSHGRHTAFFSGRAVFQALRSFIALRAFRILERFWVNPSLTRAPPPACDPDPEQPEGSWPPLSLWALALTSPQPAIVSWFGYSCLSFLTFFSGVVCVTIFLYLVFELQTFLVANQHSKIKKANKVVFGARGSFFPL